MDYHSLPDDILLKLLKADDELAYKVLYNRYWKNLFLKAYAKTHSKETAEEIVQDIFYSLWQNRNKNKIENLHSYLLTALKYQVITHIREKIRRQEKISALIWNEADSTTDSTIALNELASKLREAVSSLPGKTREVFLLSRVEKMQVSQIARNLQLSEKAVEYHITRSLKLLRLHLKDFISISPVILLLFFFKNIL